MEIMLIMPLTPIQKKFYSGLPEKSVWEKKAFKENPFRPVDSSKNGHFK